MNLIDKYWNEHTVAARTFTNIDELKLFMNWRIYYYPMFQEYMRINDKFDDQVVLDYGCGPGTDIAHKLIYSNAKKIIGMDISSKALEYASHYISLCDGKDRTELVQIGDENPIIPLQSDSIDYINCGGVLHHVTHPEKILAEFYRVLRKGGTGRIMVYNRDSIFYNLFVGYVIRHHSNLFHLPTETVFAQSTDGATCPKSVSYKPKDFTMLCESAGFKTEFIGGYLSKYDSVEFFMVNIEEAMKSTDLDYEHKKFLMGVIVNEFFPSYQGKVCGIGGVYEIVKE